MMNSTGTYSGRKLAPKRGEVYLAEIEFLDFSGTKIRPLVIVATDVVDLDVVAIFITSTQARYPFDVVIEYWGEAGLQKPSVARAGKPLTIHPSRLLKKLGELNPHDFSRVITKCKERFE